jgi:sulfur carrier protein
VPGAPRYLWYYNIAIMKIVLNGKVEQLESPMTVAQLLRRLDLGDRRVAVEINREIVPRSRHVAHQLQDNDRVEVVRAIGGGAW